MVAGRHGRSPVPCRCRTWQRTFVLPSSGLYTTPSGRPPAAGGNDGCQPGAARYSRLSTVQAAGAIEPERERIDMRGLPSRVSRRGRHPGDADRRGAEARVTRAGAGAPRILVVQSGFLGDVVLTTPVLAALRRCFP